MPTTYRPEFAHKHFDWGAALAEIEVQLAPLREEIFRVIGFYDEYGEPEVLGDEERQVAEAERALIMGQIAGVLASAAAIRIDAGFKPENRVLATVTAVIRDPTLLLGVRETMEPEALGAIAAQYQRGAEAPGTHWQDITGDGGRKPSQQRVKIAARAAAASLAFEARKGGREDVGLKHLAARLGEVFGQFRQGPVSRVVATANDTSGLAEGTEYGPFKDFLNLVLPALETVLNRYPGFRPISRDSLVRRTMRWQRRESPLGLYSIFLTKKGRPLRGLAHAVDVNDSSGNGRAQRQRPSLPV